MCSSPGIKDPFMLEAIAQAKEGLAEGGIPIGSVLVKGAKVIGRGRNQRLQKNDPVLHAEIDCLSNAGRIGSYKGAVLYSTLMPCYLCGGAIIQFGIRKVVAGESRTFVGSRALLEKMGIEVIDLDLDECRIMMEEFIRKNPDIWNEDIGNK